MTNKMHHQLSRRHFLGASAAVTGGLLVGQTFAEPKPKQKALIAISLDLEMARNFPKWEDSHWDYEKGNLNDEAKKYAVEASRRVKAAGGVIHFFLVGRALEQENVDWLKEIVQMGHRIGNHTYDHVYVRAKTLPEVQYRFSRAPWLLAGKTPLEAVRENVILCSEAIRTRLGIEPAGFRTPGGFADGLIPAPEVQRMFLDLGFKWVSCKYPAHLYNETPGASPTKVVFDSILKEQSAAQPFVYPSGLIDIPMSPISDIGAFRNGKWNLDEFLKAIRLGVEWAIEHGAVYDFLSHPSVLYPKDPEFKAIELICDLVKKAGDRAAIVDLDTIAQRVKA
ncbi:MAG: putative xylanase/chitin deacetylase [Verrucomicrobiales bacterium]|nr:putative xylanase/chitin deacetylase [Verrucomicrobiales bacterium]